MIRFALAGKGMYRKGSGVLYPRPRKNQVLFLFLTEPSEAEIKHIAKGFKLKEKTFKQFGKEKFSRTMNTRPFQFVMRDFFTDENKIKEANLLFTLLENTLIIVSSKKSSFYTKLFEDMSDEMKEMQNASVAGILYSFLLEDIEDNYDVLEKAEEQVVVLEKEAAKTNKGTKAGIAKIMSLKKDLFKMSRQFQASTKIISVLRKGRLIKTDSETKMMLSELHDTFLHQIDVAASQREMLSDIIVIHSTNVSNRLSKTSNEMNIVMKRLAGFALIIMVPTFITGVYGMNFKYLPLSGHPLGFLILLIIMAGSAVWLSMILGKRGWL